MGIDLQISCICMAALLSFKSELWQWRECLTVSVGKNINVGTYAVCKSCNELRWLTRYVKNKIFFNENAPFQINKQNWQLMQKVTWEQV